ncbi:MAG TPA: hypothetical protein VM186_10030 [Planctomycetota bacterium]|nr:hypothetical protein [Planctomycetota bacterium]
MDDPGKLATKDGKDDTATESTLAGEPPESDVQQIGKVPQGGFFTVRVISPKPPKPYLKTTITLGAWTLLILFAMAAACSLSMLCLKQKMLYSNVEFAASLRREPVLRNVVEGYYDFVWWAAFIVFFLSAVAALGALRRKGWSLKMMRRLSYVWCGLAVVCVVWWAASVWGLVKTGSPVASTGLLFCLLTIGLSWAVRRFLTFPQVLGEFKQSKPQKLSFMPGIMMMPAE